MGERRAARRRAGGRGVAAVVLIAAGVLLTPAAARATPDFTVYDDQLASGFEYWGWAAVEDFGYTAQKHGGAKSIYWEPWNWDGLQLHSNSGFDVAHSLELRSCNRAARRSSRWRSTTSSTAARSRTASGKR